MPRAGQHWFVGVVGVGWSGWDTGLIVWLDLIFWGVRVASDQSLQIVIRAQDRFSAAFAQLGQSLHSVERSGASLADVLQAVRGRMGGYQRGAAEAGAATGDFAHQVQGSLGQLATLRELFREEQQGLADEAARHGERLRGIDSETESGRTELALAAQQRRRQLTGAHYRALEGLAREAQQRQVVLDQALLRARLELFRTFSQRIATLAEAQGRAMGTVAKTLAVANALIHTYQAANAALASVPFPLNFAAAAVVTAQGLANVQRIRQVNAAHQGLETVPEDATFLLRRGERVLSPNQNRELTAFLGRNRESSAGGVVVENLAIHILENATVAEGLLALDRESWRDIVAERIIPALDELAALGVGPASSGEGL